MKNILIGIGLILCMGAFISADQEKQIYIPVSFDGIAKGEVIEYKLNYGIFSIGEGTVKIHDKFHRVNLRNCYKLDVFGKTTGAISWIAKVNDHWGAYVDSEALVPHMAYRNIKEGNYKLREITKFDHNSDMVEVKVIDNATGKFKEPMYYKTPNNIRDIITGYIYLRAIDFKNIAIGDTIKINAFFEDTIYDFNILYEGKGTVKTKMGIINALKLVPVMPDNQIFDGENSITCWVSDDIHRIPVKVEADMFIGKASCELINYTGFSSNLNFAKRFK